MSRQVRCARAWHQLEIGSYRPCEGHCPVWYFPTSHGGSHWILNCNSWPLNTIENILKCHLRLRAGNTIEFLVQAERNRRSGGRPLVTCRWSNRGGWGGSAAGAGRKESRGRPRCWKTPGLTEVQQTTGTSHVSALT